MKKKLLTDLSRSGFINTSTNIENRKPILIQGAMTSESAKLVEYLEDVSTEQVGGWYFWKGTINSYPIIVSKTMIGMSNAAAATTIALERYQPIAIINQGTAGGHNPDLHVFDIVLGSSTLNIGAFKSPILGAGEGSNSLKWEIIDVLSLENSETSPAQYFKADPNLLAIANATRSKYQHGKVLEGIIGSADFWNNEWDRIEYFQTHFKTSVEEMEAASAAQIAYFYQTPYISVRIVSNNITNDSKYAPQTGVACQEFVYEIVKNYIIQLNH